MININPEFWSGYLISKNQELIADIIEIADKIDIAALIQYAEDEAHRYSFDLSFLDNLTTSKALKVYRG